MGANGFSSLGRKAKEPRPPCPQPVPLDDLLEVPFFCCKPSAQSTSSELLPAPDIAKDIVDAAEPTLTVRWVKRGTPGGPLRGPRQIVLRLILVGLWPLSKHVTGWR